MLWPGCIYVPGVGYRPGGFRKIIGGSYRKAIAEELGYDYAEIVTSGLIEEQVYYITLKRGLTA